jgi:hypothetical protein
MDNSQAVTTGLGLNTDSLFVPRPEKTTGRKVWSVDLETVWLPTFTASNAAGKTFIPSEALGAPIRLKYADDGSVKFTKSGRPVTQVHKDISNAVAMVRENLIANLMSFTERVAATMPDAYKEQVRLAQEAGEPIVENDRANLQKAFAEIMAEADERIAAQAGQSLEEAPAFSAGDTTPVEVTPDSTQDAPSIEANAEREVKGRHARERVPA